MGATYITPATAQRRFVTSLAIAYVFFLVPTITTGLRMVVRRRIDGTLRIDDWLILAAFPFAVAIVAIFHVYTETTRDLLLAVPDTEVLDDGILTPDQLYLYERQEKFFYFVGTGYIIALGLVRLSILQFYHRFMKQKIYRILNHCLSGVVILTTIVLGFMSIFQCIPISSFWKTGADDDADCQLDLGKFHIASSCMNIALDVFILVLPIRIVLQLQMSQSKKWFLAIVFGMGAVATVATILRLAFLLRSFSEDLTLLDLFEVRFLVHIFVLLEIGLGTICANIPSLAALLRVMRKGTWSSYSRNHGSHGRHYELSDRNKPSSMRVKGEAQEDSSMVHIVPGKGNTGQSIKSSVEYEEPNL